MFNNLVFSLNCVLPIFIIIAFGFLLKQKDYLDEHTVKKINTLSFNFAIPFLLFRDIASADLGSIIDFRLLSYALISTLVIFILLWIGAKIFIKNEPSIGSFVQGCFRGNYAIIGLSLAASILGPDKTSKAALITTFVIPLYNLLAVIVLTFTSGNKNGNNVKEAVKNICKNPLIIGIAIGLPFSIFNIALPKSIMNCVNYMAQLATPLALLAIGGSINFEGIKASFKLAMSAAFIKLIIVPIISLSIAILIGIKAAEDLVILYLMYASPTAINSFIMASKMGADEDLAANIVLLTTVFSVITFTFGIYIFKAVGIL